MSVTDSSGAQPVVIVGAGYSGTLAAVNLLRQKKGQALRVILIEQRPNFARGLAYSCRDDTLLLNVPAGNMSALADEPGDFLRYCHELDPQLEAGSFMPRRIYGDYLAHVLARAETAQPGVLERITGEATAVRQLSQGAGFEVALADGRTWKAEQVVLALGHAAPRPAWPAPRSNGTGYIDDPWDFATLARIPPSASVLILGTGHTAVDALLQLAAENEQRKFFLLSRRGVLPQAHRFTPKPPVPTGFPTYLQSVPPTLLAYFRALRSEIARRQTAGSDWRDVINELRPHTPDIWMRLPPAERKRFLRHAGAYWDIHRHRLAPSAHARLHDLLQSGRAELVAGRTLAYEHDGEAIKVTVRQRRTRALRELAVAAVLNCTGPNYDIATLASPLVTQLCNAGLLRQDALHLGLEVDERYRVINRQGASTEGLYYLGPMLRARYWEATAVPELRGHALQLVRQILAAHNR